MSTKIDGCWICGKPASTREHRFKRSDGKATFGQVSQSAPLFVTNRHHRNRRLGSLDASVLKFTKPLCEHCNTSLTQPYDLAWAALSRSLRTDRDVLIEKGGFHPPELFAAEADRVMLGTHLYFVKLMLGQIVEAGIQVNPEPFRQSLLSGTEYPLLYLKFGYDPEWLDVVTAGQSDLEAWFDHTHRPEKLGYVYDPGFGIEIQVLWSRSTQPPLGGWRPDHGGDWIQLHNLSGEAETDTATNATSQGSPSA